MAAADVIADIARDLRRISMYADLEAWIDLAAENDRNDGPEGKIAGYIWERLHSLKNELEPMIERQARRLAEAEAAAELEAAS